MATVYLNIGLPQTGAAAVQAFLRENEEALKNQGYCFPNLQLNIKKQNRNACFLMDKSDVRQNAFAKLEKLAKEYDSILLFDEQIWQAAAEEETFWEEAANDFAKIGCSLKVIVYLQRQDLLIQSLWLANVQSNVVKETRCFHECLHGGAFLDFPMDYYRCLTRISEKIGKENLLVRVCETEQLEGEERSVFSDFLKAAGIPLTEQYTRENVKEDWKLKGNFIEIKRILNNVPAYRNMEDFMCEPINQVSEHLAKSGRQMEVSLFARDEQEAYLKQYEESNRKTAEEFLGRADGKLFYEEMEELPHWSVDEDTMEQDILLFATAVFCKQEKRLQNLKTNIQDLQNNFLFKVCKKVYKKIRYRR